MVHRIASSRTKRQHVLLANRHRFAHGRGGCAARQLPLAVLRMLAELILALPKNSKFAV